MTEAVAEKSLFEKLGEGAGIKAVVDRLYELIMADETLAPFFSNTELKKQKGHMALFLTAATGGPNGYQGLDMDAAHAGRGISDENFDAVIGHAATALSEAGVDDETIGVVAGALLPLRVQVVTGATAA